MLYKKIDFECECAIELFTASTTTVNGEVPPVKGRPRKLPHYANRGKTSSSGGELASARSCFSTVRTALGKLRITGLLAQFDIARVFHSSHGPCYCSRLY